MNKKERVLQILNALTVTQLADFTFMKFEKDALHNTAFNLYVDTNDQNIETGAYNIAVLDDSVCFHKFSIRGSIFMHYAPENDPNLFNGVEYASRHENYLQSLGSTKAILDAIVPMLEGIGTEKYDWSEVM